MANRWSDELGFQKYCIDRFGQQPRGVSSSRRLPVDRKSWIKKPFRSQMVLIERCHPFQPLHGKWLLLGSHWSLWGPGVALMLFGDLPPWFNAEPFHTSRFRMCEVPNYFSQPPTLQSTVTLIWCMTIRNNVPLFVLYFHRQKYPFSAEIIMKSRGKAKIAFLWQLWHLNAECDNWE